MDNDVTATSKPDVADAIATLIANLPAPVREFVNGPDRDRIALELMQKHDLHADQAGEFERAYIRMLLGVDTPDEFTASLRQAGISDISIAGLTNDVNELVFKPLRKIEQEGPVSVATPAQPAPAVVRETAPAPVVSAPPPTPEPAPPIPQPTYAPPAAGAHQQTYWVPVSITAVPQPYITTEPPPNLYPQPVVAQPPPIPPPPPIPEPAPVEVERTVVPPPPLPQPTWQPAPPPNLPTHEGPHMPLTKEYAADPYREPPV